MKRLAQIALLTFVIGALGLWVWARVSVSSEIENVTTVAPFSTDANTVADKSTDAPKHVVYVTYFTSDVRCPTCRTIEALTRRTVEERFASELAAGMVVFETRNLDDVENRHFADDYALSFKTVVLSDQVEGQERAFAKMDDVWSHANEPGVFMNYLEGGIRGYLDPAS